MLFNSLSFLIFFPVVTVAYFLSPQRWRTPLLLAASCVFYMAFVPSYILILVFTIVVDYFAGIWIDRSVGRRRKAALIASIVANVGVLAVFKYYRFVFDNLAAIRGWTGVPLSLPALNIILPIGLSFHTFQAMSYTIEVYRGAQKPERNFLTYALYVMFYPQLVAGPIERPQNLLHQFYERHEFVYDRVAGGLVRMAIGLFKKVVLADSLASYVNLVYSNPRQSHGIALVVATVFFAFQIYWDFSGYSDIALGSAQVMGFRLMENFRTPYLARSIGEFWRRWHISLSTWFRDYLYVPLGGAKGPALRTYRNLMIVFLLSGLWHGASWNFVIWGGLHGTFLIIGRATRPLRERVLAAFRLTRESRFVATVSMAANFVLVTLAWVFFRARTFDDAIYVLTHFHHGVIADTLALVHGHAVDGIATREIVLRLLLLAVAVPLEYLLTHRGEQTEGVTIRTFPARLRYAIYFVLIYATFYRGGVGQPQFIYFQF
jgi:alginate O-acetyltransferase complex protein AlgI